MSAYARPVSLDAALRLLATNGSVAMGGGTDLAGQVDRGLRAPRVIVDLQAVGLNKIRADKWGVTIGATVTLAELATSPVMSPFTAVQSAARAAASPILRNVATVGGNLCQHTRCWYYRGEEWNCWLGGGDTCYAQIGDHRKHNLQPGACISAHPSDLAPALAACNGSIVIASRRGERELPLLQLYRRPSEDNRSLLTLASDELVTHVRLPRRPASSCYMRAGERQAFSFPLVGVAAARIGTDVRVVANGIANIPYEVDLCDPLDGLPGNPQSAWKRQILATLVSRALTKIASGNTADQ